MIPLSSILRDKEDEMIFEDNLMSRLSMAPSSVSDPPETDLDYYARPENYSGSNIHSIQRVFQLQQKQGQLKPTIEEASASSMPGSRVATPGVSSAPMPNATSDAESGDERTSERTWTRGRSVRPTSTDSRPRTHENRRKSLESRPKTAETLTAKLYVTEPSDSNIPVQPRARRLSRSFSGESLVHDPETGRDRRVSLGENIVDPRTGRVRKVSFGETDSRPGTTASEVSRGSARSRLSRISQASQAVSAARTSASVKEARAQLARERFRHAGRLVLMALKWVSTINKKPKEDQELMTTFTDLATAFNSGELQNSGLTFDPSEYKAKKEINISQEVQHILSHPTHSRTPEQLQTALFGLQHLRSFAEYPLHMQEKLCKVAWFEKVPPNRIIIRQGHTAENFYFILSGHAVVKILEKHPKTGETQLRTATIMRKGMSFGELALLHHSKRTATVASQDTVQLLTIGRDDFFDIFMSGQGPGEIPDHIKYISTLDFMADWPIQKLAQHPEMCLFHFFKRGVVIVKDSTKSDWLYIVKSGSCQVMKQLKGVTPKLGYRASALAGTNGVTRLPKLGTGEVGSKVDTRRKRPHGHSQRTRRCRSALQGDAVDEVKRINDPYPHKEAEDAINRISPNQSDDVEVKGAAGYSKSKFRAYPRTNKAHFSADLKRAWNRPESKQREEEPNVQENNHKGPVFVQIELLKPRDVFGLTTIHFNDDIQRTTTTVSLVSRGAECIMLSKKFFAQHATEKVKRLIRHQIRPYPTDHTLQENLQIKADWQLYKRNLIRSLVSSKV